MAKNVEHVSHIKSKLKINGLPQLPSPDKLVDGEIAINYAEGVETISIRNENSAITTFSSDNYYTEKKLGSGFTNNDATVTEAIDDLNGRKLDASAYTPTDLSDYYKKSETSGATELSTAFVLKANDADLDAVSGTVNTHITNTDIHVTAADKTNWNNKSDFSGSYNDLTDKPTIPSKTSDLVNDNGFATSAYVQTVTNDMATKTWVGEQNYLTSADISGKQDVTGMTAYTTTATTNTLSGTVTAHTADSVIHVTADDKSKWNSVDNKLNTSDFNTYSGAVDTAIGNKVDKVSGKDLSSNDFTDALKTKLDNIASGAEVNVQADWTETATTADSYIQNKPTLGTAAAKGVSTGITNSDNLIEAKHIYSGVGVTVAYDSESHYIQLKNTAGSVLSSFNASTFLVDGMVDSVTLETKSGTTYLVITWNTAAGKTDTELNIGDIFEADNYYTTAQTDTAIEAATSGKVNTSTFTAHTASTVHMSTTEKTNLDSLATNIAAISGITSTKVSNWDGAATDSHTHSNKSVLDGISSTDITNWNSKTSNVGTVTSVQIGLPTGLSAATTAITESGKFDVKFSDGYSIPTTLKQGQWDEAYTAKHSHDNKTVLDGITTAKTSSWDTAATSAHNHSNKSTLDAITASSTAINSLTGAVGTMAFQNTSSYSSATQVNTALSNKADKTAVDDLSGQSETVAAALTNLDKRLTPTEEHVADSDIHLTSEEKLKLDTIRRRTRKLWDKATFISTLKKAVADQDLEKYGMRVGDYCTTTNNGKTYNYVIAGLNTMKGTSTPNRLDYNHIGIIVDTNDTYVWNSSNSTSTSQNTHSTDGTWTTGTAAAGYASCDLQYYLETTVLPYVEGDLGSNNIKSHYKLYSTAVNTSGYNRFGNAGGCSSSWAWYADQKICALSEVQVYGSIVWSSSGYDTGEACRQLDVFRVYNMNEIFEGRYPWLRDVASSSSACRVHDTGAADYRGVDRAHYVAALILFA